MGWKMAEKLHAISPVEWEKEELALVEKVVLSLTYQHQNATITHRLSLWAINNI